MSMGISRLFDRRISIRTYLAATIFFTTIPIAAFLIFYIKGLWDDGVHHAHDKAYVEAEKMSAVTFWPNWPRAPKSWNLHRGSAARP